MIAIDGVFYLQRLVSVGLDQHATVNVWDWRKGKILATARGHSDRVCALSVVPLPSSYPPSLPSIHGFFVRISGVLSLHYNT